MPQIRFIKDFPPLQVDDGENLMFALLKGDRPVASSCQGEGVCCKCLIEIIEGSENLSVPNTTEEVLNERHKFSKTARVSCQTQVWGDIVVDAKYW
ncbi:MAG: 2Fe-2S iron-sulfur cluster-binding protein [Pseudobdellovibrionaceae bacterium]